MLHHFALTQVWQSVVKRRDICAANVQPKCTPNIPKCHEKVGRTPLVSSMDSSVRPFFDRQKLIWRTLDAFRTNFWGEKWENQKASRWVGCKLIQIRRCAKPIINGCNHDHNLLWCPKAVPVFHHWDWMDWGMFFWTSPKHTQTVLLNCMHEILLFSEAVIAVQLRNIMFPLALRWPALRPPQQLLRDTNGKTVFFSGCSCRDRGWVGSASMTLKTETGGAVKKKNSKIL